jgi:hypothetical protein
MLVLNPCNLTANASIQTAKLEFLSLGQKEFEFTVAI